MNVEATVTINSSKEAIWAAITDIERAPELVSAIETVEILEKPENGLVGLKWRETRKMFGKTATEDMWITETAENEFYKTRAESHGSVYFSKMSISEQGGKSLLTMTFDSVPQSFMAKLLAVPMGLAFKGSMKKTIAKDLSDIKAVVEQQ